MKQGDTVQALSVAQKAVHAEPARPDLRRDVASLLVQQRAFQPALAVFAGSSSQDNVDVMRELGSLRAIAGSLAPNASGRSECAALQQAQRAIKLSPWQKRNWQTLAFVRAQCAE
jgi:superkiller protein 3